MAQIGDRRDHGRMAGPVRARVLARLTIARAALIAFIAAASLADAGTWGSVAPVDAASARLAPWTGGIDLYRSGAYTTQKTWLWCTAADVQIIRNISAGQADHTKAGQQRYFDYMRAHNRYPIPVSDGIDPAGWTAGLRHFVDGRYALYESRSFDAALRSVVTNLRETGLPVAITVSHGNHAWIITGFTASADPAVTSDFAVTSVRVVGPLWGLQNRSFGYDMKPDTKLTVAQLEGFFTPWHYAPIKMAWEKRWVSIQPVSVPLPAPTPVPAPRALGGATVARLQPVQTTGPAAGVLTGLATATASTGSAAVPAPGGDLGQPAEDATADPPWLGWIGVALVVVALARLAPGSRVRGLQRRSADDVHDRDGD